MSRFGVGELRSHARRATVCLALVACRAGVLGATDADLARARDLTPRGAVVFARRCASCHGKHGEGLTDAPQVMGTGALPEYPREYSTTGMPGVQDPAQMQIEEQTRRTGSGMREPFRNAYDVYAFVSLHPRDSRKGHLADEDWAVTTFLIAAQGAALPAEGVTAENATSIPIPHK